MPRPKEWEQELKSRGFWYVRQNRHQVWTNGVHKITVPVSPSDSVHAFKNFLSKLRRLLGEDKQD